MTLPTDPAALYQWHRGRLATDIADEPKFIGDHAFHDNAYLNWGDLERINNAILTQFPEVVFFPGIYTDTDQSRAPSPDAIVPIFKSITDCVRKAEHYRFVRSVRIRWPWADEMGSDNPDILSGRIRGARSPWLGSLSTSWAQSRRIGRTITLDVRFSKYLPITEIKTWRNHPYWAAQLLPDGRPASALLPESWCFPEGDYTSLEGGYHKSAPDRSYFCEAIKRIWRQNTTKIYARYDVFTGEILDKSEKAYEARYGFNTLKHTIDGSRRYFFISSNPDFSCIGAVGPRKAHIKKVMATADSPLDFE